MTDGERLAALRALWAETRKAEKGDLLHAYLASRGISVEVPDDLRFAPRIRDGEGGIRPAMVALVRDGDGKPVDAAPDIPEAGRLRARPRCRARAS